MSRSSVIWITWEDQVRNRSLAAALNIPLFELVYPGVRPVRYLRSILSTVALVHRHRPRVIVHQNPSIVLGLMLLALRLVYRFRTVSDNHNAGLFPLEGRHRVLNAMGRRIWTGSDVAVVHNPRILHAIPHRADALVLPDPLPLIQQQAPAAEPAGSAYLVYVCLWSADEPYAEVIEAAWRLEGQSPLRIVMTGRPPEHVRRTSLPSNVELSGFLPRPAYEALLTGCSGVMALTTRQDSLNCAGYEALAAAKPCILSDTESLRAFFGSSFVYTKNDALSIQHAMTMLLERADELGPEMRLAREAYLQGYQARLVPLRQAICRLWGDDAQSTEPGMEPWASDQR